MSYFEAWKHVRRIDRRRRSAWREAWEGARGAVEVVGAALAFAALLALAVAFAFGIPVALLWGAVRVVRLAWTGE